MAKKYNSEFVMVINGSQAAKSNLMYLQAVEASDKLNKKDVEARKSVRIPICTAMNDGSLAEETPAEFCKRVTRLLNDNQHSSFIVVTLTASTLSNLYRDNLLKLNIRSDSGRCEINNEAQRLEAWTPKMQSQYIFDIMRGKYADAPSMRVQPCEGQSDLLVFYPNEGQQRTISNIKFQNGTLTLTGTGTWLDGMNFNDFDVVHQQALRNLPLTMVVLDERYQNAHFHNDLFYKTNTCGAALNKTEKAAALKKTMYSDAIRNLVTEKAFTDVVALTENKTNRQVDTAIMMHAMALCEAAVFNEYTGVPAISNGTQSHYNEAIVAMMDEKKKGEITAKVTEAKRILKLMKSLKLNQLCFGTRKNKNGLVMPASYTSNKKFVSVYFLCYNLYNMLGQEKVTDIMSDGQTLIYNTVESIMGSTEWETLMNGGTNDLARSLLLTDAVAEVLYANQPKMRVMAKPNAAFYKNVKSYRAFRAKTLKLQTKKAKKV